MPILIVGDFGQTRELVRDSLAEFGQVDFEEVSSGAEGLQRLISRDFELAIVDIEMQRMGAFALIDQMRRRNPVQKILVITGRSNSQYLWRAIQLGAAGFISKETDSSCFAELVRSMLKS